MLNKERNLDAEKYEGVTFRFIVEDLLIKLENYIKDNPIDLLVMDAFLDLFDGTMNDGGQVRKFLTLYDQLASKYEFLIVFLLKVLMLLKTFISKLANSYASPF